MRSHSVVSFLIGFLVLLGLSGPAISTPLQAAGGLTAYLPLIVGPPAPPEPPVVDVAWLTYLNQVRALAGLPTVSDNATYSDGAYKHARYMVKNDVIDHDEDPANPLYTGEGQAAARSSNLMVSTSSGVTDEQAIDVWMLGPFHGVGLIDASLTQVGFGSFREEQGGWQMGAALNVLNGLAAQPPAGVTFPVMWPRDGATSWLERYTGGELPDPLTNCAGYVAPTGAPIYLMLGTGSLTPSVSASSLQRAGSSLEHCVYTEGTYTNPGDAAGQSLGRTVLGQRDAVILIPRAPLADGDYDVSMTVSGTTYSWSFTIDAGARP